MVSGLMVLSLVLTACAPAAVEEQKPAEKQAPEVEERKPAPAVEQAVPVDEKPKYGGTLTYLLDSEPTSFDSGAGQTSGPTFYGLVYEKLIDADWRRSIAWGGQTNFAVDYSAAEDVMAPRLAESWKMPEQGIWVLQIRRGVHWQPVNSEAGRLMGQREMNVSDIIRNFKRMTGPTSAMFRSQQAAAKAATIEQTGPWEVTARFPVDHFIGFWWVIWGGTGHSVLPADVAEKYGDIENWRNAVGTGPWMVAEYIPGSALTYVRNPAYWERNPIPGPGLGDQLPYIEKVRQLIIPDMSTQLAALRTAKLDVLALTRNVIDYDQAQTVLRYNPEIQFLRFLPQITGRSIAFRLDIPNQPFSDVRVRQALMMATDFEAIKRDYYRGQAEIDVYPVTLHWKGTGVWVPLSEMPETVQALYRYNPERAKQLLKEAGYPSGIKANIVVQTFRSDIDDVAIFKDMWSKVGVELNILPREPAVYSGITRAQSWDHMLYTSLFSHFTITMSLSGLRGNTAQDPSRTDVATIRDPAIEAAWEGINRYIFQVTPKAYQELKKLRPYVMEQAFRIAMPTPYSHSFWWPWVKNYGGQGVYHGLFLRYIWIGQDLREQMIGRR